MADTALIEAPEVAVQAVDPQSTAIMPLKRALNSAEWVANADLFMIELEAAA